MGLVIQDNEIILSGMVGGSAAGDSWWDPPGFNSGDVIEALAQVGRDTNIVVRLNSGGGIATEGSAIHSALSQHKGTVQMIVEGVAASAASVIAMAGDTVTMMPGAVLMIHDPAGMTFGDVTAHEQSIKALNALGDAYAGIYADKTGKGVDEMRALMRAETWMTPDQAIAAAFADAQADPGDEGEPDPSPFAYEAYARAPERLVVMAKARNWRPTAMVTTQVPLKASQEPEPQTEPEPPAPAAEIDPAADAVAIAATCGSFGMTAEQISAFIAEGGTLERAQARAAEMDEIREVLEAAARANPAVSLKPADAVARGLTLAQVRAEVLPQTAAQIPINTQAPAVGVPEDPKSLMVAAAERANAAMKKLRG